MIHLLIDVCSIDLLPIEQSPHYQAIVKDHGEVVASVFMFEVIVPPWRED